MSNAARGAGPLLKGRLELVFVFAGILLVFGVKVGLDWRSVGREAEFLEAVRDRIEVQVQHLDRRIDAHQRIVSSAATLVGVLSTAPTGGRVAVADTLVAALLHAPADDVFEPGTRRLVTQARLRTLADAEVSAAVVSWPGLVERAVAEEEEALRFVAVVLTPGLRAVADISSAEAVYRAWGEGSLPRDREPAGLTLPATERVLDLVAERAAAAHAAATAWQGIRGELVAIQEAVEGIS